MYTLEPYIVKQRGQSNKRKRKTVVTVYYVCNEALGKFFLQNIGHTVDVKRKPNFKLSHYCKKSQLKSVNCLFVLWKPFKIGVAKSLGTRAIRTPMLHPSNEVQKHTVSR